MLKGSGAPVRLNVRPSRSFEWAKQGSTKFLLSTQELAPERSAVAQGLGAPYSPSNHAPAGMTKDYRVSDIRTPSSSEVSIRARHLDLIPRG